jgi:hypothetical protein
VTLFITHTWEKQLFELLSEVFLIDEYPHDAVLNDVGHKHDVFVRLSNLIVGEKGKCYMQNEDI